MKYNLNITGYLILLVFSGCSFLTKYPVLTEKNSDHWERSGTCENCESYESYKTFTYNYIKSANENFSISICPCTYGFVVSFGPPLIPFIPNLGLLFRNHRKNNPFFVDILFGNFNGKRVALGSVKFFFPGKNMELKADSIVVLSQNKPRQRKNVRTRKEKGRQIIVDSLYQFEQDTTRLRFYFNSPKSTVHELSIDFSGFQVNGNLVPFSPINFVKKSRFIYDPFVTGH